MADRNVQVGELMHQAVALHQAGQLGEAERLYRLVLQHAPHQADAMRLLATLALQTGRPKVAEQMLRRALADRPKNAELHYMTAMARIERGDGAGAAASARTALELEPDYLAARLVLGNGLFLAGDRDGARATWQEILEADPDHVPTLFNLTQLLLEDGLARDAQALLTRIVVRQPAHAPALALLGELRIEADARYAIELLRQSLILAPDIAGTHIAFGRALSAIGDYVGAEREFRAALKLERDNTTALSGLAQSLRLQKRYDEALAAAQRLLSLVPGHADAAATASMVHDALWQPREAVDVLRPVFESGGAEAASLYVYGLNFLADLSPQQIFEAHRDWARRQVDRLGDAASPFANDRDPDRRLRIGYVSPDFRRHSVAYFAAPVIAGHDRSNVEVTCYSNVELADAMTDAFRAKADRWRDIEQFDDAQAAQMIRDDGIDVLIDLAGHTGGNRLPLFARRPAPVQITWLGYPNTTGMQAMGWRIVDALSDPPGPGDALHTERLLRLPSGFLCFEPPALALDPGPPPSVTQGFVTFGSFNNLRKVSPPTVAAWAALLQRVPRSRLLLKDRRFATDAVQRKLRQAFASHGVDADRLVLRGYASDDADHLAAYRDIDIALDPFPYNGTTTTCEALWMGVPCVALAGDRHAARVGIDILHRVGLDALAAPDAAGYVERAAALAENPGELATLRSTLRQRLLASPLCDAPRFVTQLEAACRTAWRQWCAAG